MTHIYRTGIFILLFACTSHAQNLLNIPPILTGTTFNLTVRSGTQSFYTSTTTPTYGINAPWMCPTISVNKGDSITLNVKDSLTVKTTIHWHGLHVAPHNDGGPHQPINPGATWSPSFTVRNNAGTFWYHPHGEGQTDPQVSKGLAGFFIVHDAAELALAIPHTYGTDDIPLVVQSKAFDALQQIAIATSMDTAIFVNGTVNPYFNAPAQVIRLRLLNGSSLRAYNFGFSNSQVLYQIATDGGLLDTPAAMTHLILTPGERAEVLVNLTGMNGQTIYLRSYASALPRGMYGADTVGAGADTIHEYYDNFLNGADFDLLKINVVAPTGSPVTSIPATLVPLTPLNPSTATNHRTLVLDTLRLLPSDVPNRADGPFGINAHTFSMDSINEVVYLNTTEIWTIKNNTLVAHPIHMHDVQFNIIEEHGIPIPPHKRGWKDVVLVMPMDSIKFITRFEDFTDEMVPYMYHCHLLHHEDDGMMGSFIVVDSAKLSVPGIDNSNIFVSPNPASDKWHITLSHVHEDVTAVVYDIAGSTVSSQVVAAGTASFDVGCSLLPPGNYILNLCAPGYSAHIRLAK